MKRIVVAADRRIGVKENYFAAVEAAGAEAVALALREKDTNGSDIHRHETPQQRQERIAAVLSEADGVVLTGGQDADPALYGQENTASIDVDRAEDDFELAVIDYAIRHGLPILAICRGMQLVNIYLGGTLTQEIARTDVHAWHDGADRLHPARTQWDSFLYAIYGDETFVINSAHHQAIDVLGQGLIPVQRSDDGVIEAVCHADYPILGVQWHPERICLKLARKGAVDGEKLFAYFAAGGGQ